MPIKPMKPLRTTEMNTPTLLLQTAVNPNA